MSHSRTRTVFAGLCSGVSLFVLAQAAAAQETVELEPITVVGTAESGDGPVNGYVATQTTSGSKTDTPIEEIPQAVTVIGEEQIQQFTPRSIVEATRYTAGVRSETFGGDTRNDWFLLRGFSSQVASYYLDGLQLFSPNFATFRVDPFLLDRIEVLRGPSSVLYGGSSPGGLVNLVSKHPTFESFGMVEAGVNEFGNVSAGFDVNGTVGEPSLAQWAYRVVGHGRYGGSFFDSIDDDNIAFAPSVTWQPDDATSLTVYGSYQRDRTNGQNFLPYVGTEVDAPFGRIDRDLFTSDESLDRFDRTQATLGYEFEHRFDDTFTFRQNTRYAYLDIDFTTLYGVGYVAPPTEDDARLARGNFITTPTAHLFNTDNQLEAAFQTGALDHRVLAGIDYRRYFLSDEQGYEGGPELNLLDPVRGDYEPTVFRYGDNETTQDQLGLYLQDQITFNDRLHLMLSGRYDYVHTDFEDQIGDTDYDTTNNEWSGRAGLLYEFDNGMSPYVAVSRSFLPTLGSAVVYTPDFSAVVSSTPYEPEIGEQWEIGLKYAPEGWNSTFGIAYFDLTRSNLVTSETITTTRQIGEARSRGIELEAITNPIPGLNIVGAFTHYNIEITEGDATEIGNRPTATPETMASLLVDYTFQDGTFAGFGAGVGVRYVGNSYADTANTLEVDGATLFDATLHYERDNFRAALNVTNIADEDYVAGCSSASACFYGEGREVMLNVSYRW